MTAAGRLQRRLGRPPWDRLVLAVVGLALFLPGLGWRDLWNPDEPRYAEVAREMRLSGDYLVPHFNDQIYTQKPPLFFWAINAAALVTGKLDETSVRLPSALAAVGTLLLVYGLGRRLFTPRAAWLSAAVFATCVKVPWQARHGQIDMLLALLVAGAVYCWVRGLQEDRSLYYRLFFVLTGLATVTKGPAGLLPALLAIVSFLLVAGRRRELRRFGIGLGLLIWVAVVLAWLVPAALGAGAPYLREMIVTQNVDRFLATKDLDIVHGHLKPWYYFLEVIPTEFFPWSFLLPGALVAGWRELRGRERPGLLFSLCWLAATVVFFSLSPSKRSVYVFQCYPALALLVGAGLDATVRSWPRYSRWLMVPPVLLAAVLAAAAAAVPRALHELPEAAALAPRVPVATAVVLAVLAAVYALAGLLALRGRPLWTAATVAAGTALLSAAALLLLAPRLDAVKSSRPLAERFSREAGPGEPLAFAGRLEAGFLFYAERYATELPDEAAAHAWARRPGRVWLMAEQRFLARLERPLPLEEVARDPDHERGFVLLRSPAAASGGTAGR